MGAGVRFAAAVVAQQKALGMPAARAVIADLVAATAGLVASKVLGAVAGSEPAETAVTAGSELAHV